VWFVIRLKANWKPKVDCIARWQITQEFFTGTDLNALVADDTLIMDGRAIDADVHIGEGATCGHTASWGSRPPGVRFLSEESAPRLGPRQVVSLYQVRWGVKLSIRLDKSVNHLDAIDTERPYSVKILSRASVSASTTVALLAYTYNVETRPQQVGAPGTEAPMHPWPRNRRSPAT